VSYELCSRSWCLCLKVASIADIHMLLRSIQPADRYHWELIAFYISSFIGRRSAEKVKHATFQKVALDSAYFFTGTTTPHCHPEQYKRLVILSEAYFSGVEGPAVAFRRLPRPCSSQPQPRTVILSEAYFSGVEGPAFAFRKQTCICPSSP
jgi:hypothetical protein